MNDGPQSEDGANLTTSQSAEPILPIITQTPINSGQVTEASPLNIISQSYSGPIPHPEMLSKYNSAIRDGAERVFRMAESDLEHQHSIANRQMALSEKLQADEFFLKKLTASAAAVLLLFGFGLVAWLAFTGHLIGSGVTGTLIAALSGIGTLAGKKPREANKE